MSAAARAEARRKAILNRGADRLARLTTSARGEDAPAFLHDDPPLAATGARNFLGEESSDMPSVRNHSSPSPSPSPQPTRRASGATPRPRTTSGMSTGTSTTAAGSINPFEEMMTSTPNSSVWSPEQQQEFIQALMHASTQSDTSGSSRGAAPQLPAATGEKEPADLGRMDNPFAALMASQLGGGAGGGAFPMEAKMPGFGMNMNAEPPKPKTKLQKVLPLLHLVAMWCLLAYFVLWVEPNMHTEVTGESVAWTVGGLWKRWADLGKRSPLLETTLETFKVHIVPFFWAFTTLQIALHSLRIFSGFDAVQPPTLLALAMPHLPPPLPSIITNSLKYMQMGSLFLDDLSGLVVGIGFIIYFSGWFAQAQS